MISLSNLLKQPYVVSFGTEKRIINSDEHFADAENFSPVELPVYQAQENLDSDSEEILDSFLEGLVAEEVTPEIPRITPEELIAEAQAEAQAEADTILAEAKAEALQIQEAAKRESETLREQSRQEGYLAGQARMQEELSQEQNRLQAEYDSRLKELQEQYDAKLETMETELVEALIRVYNHVFGIQFEDKKQILLYLIQNTLQSAGSGKNFRIRVAAENQKYIESRIGDIKEKIGNDVNIEVVSDMSLEPESCMIETEFGVFDCGIDMQLSNLEKDIRSLCM